MSENQYCHFSRTDPFKEFHAISGLYYYGFRYYEPNLQRWINRDPMGDIGSLQMISQVIAPNLKNQNFLDNIVHVKSDQDSLDVTGSFVNWSRVDANLYGGIGNSSINLVDPFGLDATSYASCLERYRNPITEQLPNWIFEKLSGSGKGKGPRVPGWLPPAIHGANALGNKLAGPVRGGVPSVSGPGHPTSWQHKTFGGKLLGRAAIVLTVFEGFWDIGLLGGCGIAEAIN